MDREKIITAAELMDMQFLPRSTVVDGMLPAGCYILAGAPKVGKSFLMAQLCWCGYRDPLPGTAHPPLPGAVSVSGGHGGARPGQADPDVRCGAPSGTPPSEI